MAIQNRLLGWAVTTVLAGSSVNLLDYYKDIEINLDVATMEARTPHDSVVNSGSHFPRPKSRKLDITLSGAIPGESLEAGGIATDNLFDIGLFGFSGNADIAFILTTPGINLTCVGIVTGGDIDFPGEEGSQSLKITARSYTGNDIVSGIT